MPGYTDDFAWVVVASVGGLARASVASSKVPYSLEATQGHQEAIQVTLITNYHPLSPTITGATCLIQIHSIRTSTHITHTHPPQALDASLAAPSPGQTLS